MTLQEFKAQFDALKPERADSFIRSIHAATAERSVTPQQLIHFLDGIIDDFVPNWKAADRKQLTLYGKILAALMIVLQQTRSFERLTERTRLLLTWCAAVVKKEYDYVALFLDALNYRVVEIGVDWSALHNAATLDIICHHLCHGIRFDKRDSSMFTYLGKGCLDCMDGFLQLGSSDAGVSGITAFTVSDRIDVYTRNAREEKLKESEQDDVEALARFADTFRRRQEVFVKVEPNEEEYEVGQIVDIKFIGYSDENDDFICEIVGPGRRIRGKILDEELVRGTWTRHLKPYLLGEDCIRNTRIVGKEGKEFLFSIKDAYQDYARNCALDDQNKNTVMEAVVTELIPQYGGRVIWMTPSGYGGISFLLEGRDMKPGDKAAMSIHSIQNRNNTLFINLCPPKYGYDTIDKTFGAVVDDVLINFVTTEEIILEEKGVAVEEPENRSQDREVVRMLASILANRAALGAGLDSYRQKLVALFLAKLTEDEDAFKDLKPELFYDRCCITFAQGNSVPADIPYSLPQERDAVVRMLSLWDSPVEEVLQLTASLPAESIAAKVGALLLGLKLASCHKDEISSDPDTIRRKISSLLKVEREFRKSAETRRGKYGKTESQEKEFKSSYVFRNDTKTPVGDIEYQGRDQVFRTVCGFLNAEGGILYVGVNDDGDPILSEGYGLNADMAWLQDHFNALNKKRIEQLGHPVCKVKTLDNYVQFLNSEKELYFSESLQGNIRIEVTEDVDAIRITVAPSEYEIAYLYPGTTRTGGKAYMRDGNRTIEMTPGQMMQRLRELKKIDKEIGFVVQIQKAIHDQKKLLFKGYSSGNSGAVQDRRVVPINLFYNDESVYCYDLASHMNKQFRLHRISAIEPLEGKFPLEKTEPKKPDVFRWLDEGAGARKYHIKLRLAAAARNYLLEEYSCAERLPAEEFYPDPEKKNKWILDTHLNGLGAVRRFYLGLADKIEILETEDSDALREDVAEYVRRFVKVGE